MTSPRSLLAAALAAAAALALTSCGSSAGSAQSNVTVLARGPDGTPSRVKVDGKAWAVCGKSDANSNNCLNATAAGLA